MSLQINVFPCVNENFKTSFSRKTLYNIIGQGSQMYHISILLKVLRTSFLSGTSLVNASKNAKTGSEHYHPVENVLDFSNLSVGSILESHLPKILLCNLHHNYLLKEVVKPLLKDL